MGSFSDAFTNSSFNETFSDELFTATESGPAYYCNWKKTKLVMSCLLKQINDDGHSPIGSSNDAMIMNCLIKGDY